MIDYTELTKSLKHLELQFANYLSSTERPEPSELDREGIAESTIQRFETCYDTLWKTLKRYLIVTLGVPDIQNSPKPILRLAFENHLLPTPIEKWLEFADARTQTAHDYDKLKAEECLSLIKDFIPDAIALCEKMTETPWV